MSNQQEVCEDQATNCDLYVSFCNDSILGDVLATKCPVSCQLCTACDKDGKCPLSMICNNETMSCEIDPDFINMTLPNVEIEDSTNATETNVTTMRGSFEFDVLGCTSGWHYFQSTDSCYLFQHTIAKYEEAAKYCALRDATLTSITSVEERDFINDEFKMKFESYWIGLKKNGDQWTWPDGTLPTSEILRWRPTQPDYCCGLNVTCTLVNYVGTEGYWDDAGCENYWNLLGQSYVCKKNATNIEME